MEMQIRPMTASERKYTYAQSTQIEGQTGSIGRLRADFGSSGNEFWSTWEDHLAHLKTSEFANEFDDVIKALRTDERFGGILKSRGAMSGYCHANGSAAFKDNYTTEYGLRVDTEKHTYLLRLNPQKGDYNLYCYCYVREWLDAHLEKAERGIRFITPDYEEKFRIPDGDKVRTTFSDGEVLDRSCRYIDDSHFEIGNNIYHICEFAERIERAGASVIPLRSSLPDKCFSVLLSTDELIILEKGTSGYTPTGMRSEWATNREGADVLNEAAGVTKAQEAAMVAGSMLGWDVPAADPSNYKEDGTPIPPKSAHKHRSEAR